MATDPFSLKAYSKLNPRRILFTLRARALERFSRIVFDGSVLPEKIIDDIPEAPGGVDWNDTAVTELQMRHLLKGLADTEQLGGCIVEVGSFRGITARCLAEHTERKIVAVDPFIGYGSVNEDYQKFKSNISDRPNVVHVRKTSGVAAAEWSHGSASLIFIDAVHDYINTSFDISAWWPMLAEGGIMAFHDTDDRNFAGTRRATTELSRAQGNLYAHPLNLTMVRKVA